MSNNRGTFRSGLSAFAAMVLLFVAADLSAQQTAGKIEGIVRDPAGQPVAGAQVVVLGTAFAAVTNESGYYFLINLPAGVYALRAQFIGYQPAEVRGARVLAGQTLTVNFGLSGAVALEAIVVSVAEQPIVPRDQVTSKAIVTGTDVDDLPVEDALSVVLLQPGVVQSRGGGISIRGGRTGEAVIFVDGAPVKRLQFGDTPLSVATNALEEVSVTTGAMDAAFGDAQAGVISFVTRSGGPDFAGTFSYETDELFGNSPNATSVGWNRFEGAISGPVYGNLTFAVGGTLQGQKSGFGGKGVEQVPSYTFAGVDTVLTVLAEGSSTDSTPFAIPRIVQYGGECSSSANFGFECQGPRAPYSWTTDLRLNGKLQFTYGSGSRISVSALNNTNQGMGTPTMNIEGGFGTRSTSNVVVLNWVQQVFRGVQSELAFDVNLSYQTDRFVNGGLDRDSDLGLRDPTMGIVLSKLDHVIDFDQFSFDRQEDYPAGQVAVTQLKTDAQWDQLVRNVRTNTGTLRPYLNRFGVSSASIPRVNAWAATGGTSPSNTGPSFGGNLNNERRFTARANVDWQANRYNRIKLGVEGMFGRVNRFAASFTNLIFGDIFTGEPVKLAAYIQDRLDLGDVVVELGLRYDRFDARTFFPVVPGRIFTHPAFDPSVADPTTNSTIWKKSEPHVNVSPRVRVSFPVTDRTGFRLSYAHQVQSPNFIDIYEGTNNDLSNTNTNDRFGGDVDFGKTILFEFGIRHAFSRDMVLDVSAYNKDKVSDHTYRILPFFDPFTDRSNNVNVLTNADFGNVRGLDVQFIRRFSNIFAGQVSYTLQNSKSTGSDPTDYLLGISRQPAGVSGVRPEPPQATLRTRDDRRHNMQGTFTVNFPADYAEGTWYGDVLREVGVFGTFQFRSGLPYTRLTNTGAGNRSTGGLGLVQNITEPLQSSETPWQKFFDLRVTKGFRFGRTDWTVYADIRNVLNFDIKTSVFTETGDIVNQEYLRTNFLDPELASMEQDARASGAWITTAAGVNAIDLRPIGPTAGCSVWQGVGRQVGCVMLQRAEARFGNGDQVYDVDEQTAAIESFYMLNQGPHTFLAPARHIRVGAQLAF